MYVIVGLGNPGEEYVGTRHNIGFDVIDFYAKNKNINIHKQKHKALIGEGFIQNKKVLLVKPQTYMNLSGESIGEIVSYYDIPLENLLIVYDDIDLEIGKLRLRAKGSAGTHNGMRSIVSYLKKDTFPRLRIGIGKPEREDLVDFVLGKFPKNQKKEIQQAIEMAGEAIDVFIFEGIYEAMNQFNGN